MLLRALPGVQLQALTGAPDVVSEGVAVLGLAMGDKVTGHDALPEEEAENTPTRKAEATSKNVLERMIQFSPTVPQRRNV